MVEEIEQNKIETDLNDFLDHRKMQYTTKALVKMNQPNSLVQKLDATINLPYRPPEFLSPQTSIIKSTFKTTCERIFHVYASKAGGVVPLFQVHNALCDVFKITPNNSIQNLIDGKLYDINKVFGWEEFYDLCRSVFKIDSIIVTNGSQSPSKTRFARSFDSYNELITKQRSVSDVSNSQTLGSLQESASNSINNNLRQSSALKDAVCEATKNSNRKMRKLEKISSHSLLSKKIPHFTKPLEKQMISDIVDPKINATQRRKIVKDKRQQEFAQINQIQDKKSVFQQFNRMVITCDKAAITKAVKLEEELTKQEKYENWLACKEKERITESNIQRWLEHEHLNKSMSAGSLRQALSSSSSMSRSLQEYEASEKHAYKASSISRLPEYTSYKVAIPEALQERIRSATRLSEYKKAKREADALVKSTISSRMNRYCELRRTAKLKAESSLSGPVALTALRAEDYFTDSSGNGSDSEEETGKRSNYYYEPRSVYYSVGVGTSSSTNLP